MLRLRSTFAAGTVALIAVSGAACSSSDDHTAENVPDTLIDAHADTSGAGGDAAHEPDASNDATDAPIESADEPQAEAAADAEAGDEPTDDAADEGDAADADAIDDASDAADAADAADAPDYTPDPVDGSACGAVVQQHPWEGANHVPECSPVTYGTNPPSSGNHYPIWGAFRTYSAPLPRGYYVHDLEHGAIVITYNCPGGCPNEVSAAQAMIDALPVDPLCPEGGPLLRRIVMTPDPLLDVRWAASAWGWTLRASCFEPQVFTDFAIAHYAQTYENFCVDGYDFTGPDGGLLVQPGCGTADGGMDGGTVTDASME